MRKDESHVIHNGIEHSAEVPVIEADLITTGSNDIDERCVSASSGSNVPQISQTGITKYAQLLSLIEDMNKDVRPSYAGNKLSTERIKKGIIHARILVRECLIETEKSAQNQ